MVAGFGSISLLPTAYRSLWARDRAFCGGQRMLIPKWRVTRGLGRRRLHRCGCVSPASVPPRHMLSDHGLGASLSSQAVGAVRAKRLWPRSLLTPFTDD